MILCKNCGVELDEGLAKCPLCGKVPGEEIREEEVPANAPSGILLMHKKENLRYLWELFGIIAFSGIVVCTIVDLLISKGLGWSLYSDISIITAWVIITLFLFARRKKLIIIPAMTITILAALLLIDLITNGMEWFIPIGVPLTLALFTAVGIITLLYSIVNLKGLNFIAVSLVVLSGLCILAELILDEYHSGTSDLRWSLIAAVSILPVSLILTFYHYRLKKGNRLDSFFHV